MTPTPTTLAGYLGHNREIRWTEARTETRTRYNEIAECDEEYEVTIPARAYAVLSMSTKQKLAGRWETVWVRLIAWDVYRGTSRMPVLLARKGDEVRVTGPMETVTFTDKKGQERTMTQLVVSTFSIVQSQFNRAQGFRPSRPSPPVFALATRKSG